VLKSESPDEVETLMAWIAEEHGRPGAKASKGFYDYDARGKTTRLWPDLMADVNELETRLLTIQALEAARCFEEGVIVDPRDADVGAILGWGFAPFTGGPISLIDTVGVAAFVARCERLAASYGERFTPNTLLHEMARKGETFYDRFAPEAAA
jgi:3-hydroxyacyl-CoA dehydrogenase/enoyl-CoA hydratase/3-hydroxybutyryl-CoA epimerase